MSTSRPGWPPPVPGSPTCWKPAREPHRGGVRVNGIICGTFDTDAAAGFVRNADLLPEVVRPVALGRVGRPTKSSAQQCICISDASTYTTGSLMTIDGGVS